MALENARTHESSHVVGEHRSIGLYIHVPFCETKCPYCDFNTYSKLEFVMKSYVQAVCRELTLWSRKLNRPRLSSIFLGGGTPSYLGAEFLGRILDTTASEFSVGSNIEVTIECNPGDLSTRRLDELSKLPINRLSIGVQAFQDYHLELLGRRHTAVQAKEAYIRAYDTGFTNINLDLMFGLPYQDMCDWKESLAQAIQLRPPHLSLYCLTLEQGTPMEQWVAQGKISDPDPDQAAEQYEQAQLLLRSAGYNQYEISNWALPGYESRHNLSYWYNLPFLGIGPGAYSYLDGYRFSDVSQPREYIKRIATWWQASIEEHVEPGAIDLNALGLITNLDPVDTTKEMGETMMLGLRLVKGVSEEEFQERFGNSIQDIYGPAMEELAELNLLEVVDGHIRLTSKGQLLGNEVFARFLDPGAFAKTSQVINQPLHIQQTS